MSMDEIKCHRIAEEFEVQKLLGKGSYGTVYRVKRLSDAQVYALKEADVQRMSPAERLDAINEIRLLASLHHPNIIRYHEAIVEDNKLCIVMEYAPNGDLLRFIKKGSELNKAFPEEILWKYLYQISQGLHHLHARQILHRDIKPANIFVGDRDVVKLGDLGIAKLIKDGVAKTQIGTPHYMAPELWMSRPYAYSSDMWALGCLMYELATYSTPFNAKNIAELRAKVLAGRYKPITPGRYSEDFIFVINGLLQLNPAKRMDMNKLLALPRMVALSHGAASKGVPHKPPSGEDLLKTIKMPADLRMLSDRLPPASYGPSKPPEKAPVGPHDPHVPAHEKHQNRPASQAPREGVKKNSPTAAARAA
eukprot:jgi/Botrbrau1/18504/Bobra.0072s0083.1